ncbi:MerR family transcriptional regulator [Oscillatoria sp. FACHB-1407]|uniref:MerR family transcriptional regulator n=1 Tax=Oscillatoria sp. FACHB-1407 TaxID=2692847 RepID=UPI0030DBBD86
MVVPQKYGNPKKPTVLYTWEQVLEIRAISHLRQKISLQTIRKIIHFLEDGGFDDSLRDKHLVSVNDEIYWVLPDWSDMPNVMKVAGKKSTNPGQLVLFTIPSLADVVDDVWKSAQSSKIIDFQSFRQRAKFSPPETTIVRAV